MRFLLQMHVRDIEKINKITYHLRWRQQHALKRERERWELRSGRQEQQSFQFPAGFMIRNRGPLERDWIRFCGGLYYAGIQRRMGAIRQVDVALEDLLNYQRDEAETCPLCSLSLWSSIENANEPAIAFSCAGSDTPGTSWRCSTCSNSTKPLMAAHKRRGPFTRFKKRLHSFRWISSRIENKRRETPADKLVLKGWCQSNCSVGRNWTFTTREVKGVKLLSCNCDESHLGDSPQEHLHDLCIWQRLKVVSNLQMCFSAFGRGPCRNIST